MTKNHNPVHRQPLPNDVNQRTSSIPSHAPTQLLPFPFFTLVLNLFAIPFALSST